MNPPIDDFPLIPHSDEPGAVIRTVPAAEAEKVLAEMASTEICSAVCPVCGELNMFTGWTVMLAYTCQHCGAGVKAEDGKIQ